MASSTTAPEFHEQEQIAPCCLYDLTLAAMLGQSKINMVLRFQPRATRHRLCNAWQLRTRRGNEDSS